jgi:hypothetical protein
MHAIGGGGRSLFGRARGINLQGTYPSNAAGVALPNGGSNPPAWTVTFSDADPSNLAFVVCAPD